MVKRIKDLCYFIKLYLGLQFLFARAAVRRKIRRIRFNRAMARMRKSNQKIARARKSVDKFSAVCRDLLAKGFDPEGG